MFDAWPEASGEMAVGVGLELESPPSDNTFSGSCKDVQHINRDMHHHDVKSASVHGGPVFAYAAGRDKSWDGSAEMGAETLPSPTIQSFSTTPGQSPGERVGGEGGGRGASSEGDMGMVLC